METNEADILTKKGIKEMFREERKKDIDIEKLLFRKFNCE